MNGQLRDRPERKLCINFSLITILKVNTFQAEAAGAIINVHNMLGAVTVDVACRMLRSPLKRMFQPWWRSLSHRLPKTRQQHHRICWHVSMNNCIANRTKWLTMYFRVYEITAPSLLFHKLLKSAKLTYSERTGIIAFFITASSCVTQPAMHLTTCYLFSVHALITCRFIRL